MNAPQTSVDLAQVDRPIDGRPRPLADVGPVSRAGRWVREALRPKAYGTSGQRRRPALNPQPRTLIGVDIAAFGAREEDMQNHVRHALYTLLEQAFLETALPWPARDWWEDRGDGAIVTVPAGVPTHRVIDPLLRYVEAGLRRHNKASSEAAKMTLRVAVHFGFVSRDSHGLIGEDIVHLCRLLDAPAFKDAIATHHIHFGLVVSEMVYRIAVRPGLGLIDPDTYTKLHVVNKETRAEAWIHLPSRAPASR